MGVQGLHVMTHQSEKGMLTTITTHCDGYWPVGTNQRELSDFNSLREVPNGVSEHRKLGFECIHKKMRMLNRKTYYNVEL